MEKPQQAVVGKRLIWVFLQGTFFLPIVLLGLLDFSRAPWTMQVISVGLILWAAYCLGRNILRLWQAPAIEASAGTVLRLAAVAAWFFLLSSGQFEFSPIAACAALLAGTMLLLAGRDLMRTRQSRYQRPQVLDVSGSSN